VFTARDAARAGDNSEFHSTRAVGVVTQEMTHQNISNISMADIKF